MRTDDTTNAETEITQIAAFGDTTLIVGPDKKKLMVQSFFLRGASEFLNNLLEFFIEAATGPIVVPFPEEDARSVEIICNVLHHRNDAVPKVLTPSGVLAVAITALSLDCIVALTWASVAWLRPTDLNDLRGLSQLMAAAYILDNSQAFGDITLAMMLHHNNPYCGLPHPNLRLNNHFSWIMRKSYS
ncbi:hypothetical protein IQ07DRAFT_517030 [Pyrenochaeta sp. DS3sAY3a]|nr:hypothetical protein IQ07DRAFT_517030 [Pyrenochaeta sp. DS3sAY3a]